MQKKPTRRPLERSTDDEYRFELSPATVEPYATVRAAVAVEEVEEDEEEEAWKGAWTWACGT